MIKESSGGLYHSPVASMSCPQQEKRWLAVQKENAIQELKKIDRLDRKKIPSVPLEHLRQSHNCKLVSIGPEQGADLESEIGNSCKDQCV